MGKYDNNIAGWDFDNRENINQFFDDLAAEIIDGDFDRYLDGLAKAINERERVIAWANNNRPTRRYREGAYDVEHNGTTTTVTPIFKIGEKVTINSPRNYSWHGLTGKVQRIGRKKYTIKLDKPRINRNGRQSTMVTVPAELLVKG